MSNVLLYHFEDVSKTFTGTEDNLTIFKNLNMNVRKGEALAIVGSSGSGKSTLLHLMGALDKPSEGRIFFEGQDLAQMNIEEQAKFRNRELGFVFQFHHLLPEFTALENAAMPGLIAGMSKSEIMPKAQTLLERVGLKDRLDSRPATLSGGERQRAAIARALVMNPVVILADEPTGNLDEHTSQDVINLILELNHELGMTLVIVTHNLELAAKMDRVLELRAGAIYEKN